MLSQKEESQRGIGKFSRASARLVAVLVAVGIAVVGLAAPSSAHHNTITASVDCKSGGGWVVTWSVENSEQRTETITASNRTSVVPVGTQLTSRQIKTFTENFTTKPSSDVTLTLSSRWTNNVTATNSGTLSKSKFSDGCAIKKVAPVDFTVTPETCTSAGKLNIPAQVTGVITKVNGNIVTPPWSTSTPGSYAVAFSAASGYELITNPSRTVVVKAKDTSLCEVVTPPIPVVTTSVCVNGVPSVPTVVIGQVEGIVITRSAQPPYSAGQTVVFTATLVGDRILPANLLPGWVRTSDKTATYTVTFPVIDCSVTQANVNVNGSCQTNLRLDASYNEDPSLPWKFVVKVNGANFVTFTDRDGDLRGFHVDILKDGYAGDGNTTPYGPLPVGSYSLSVTAQNGDQLFEDVFVREITCEQVAVPNQEPVDECNPAGVQSNIAWASPLPAGTNKVTWTESANGVTRTAALVLPGRTWTDNTIEDKVFTLPPDSGVLCPEPPVPPQPPVPPSYSCPPGKIWVDNNGDGVKQPGECKMSKPKAKASSSCVTENFGEARVWLNNKKGYQKTSFRIIKPGRDRMVKLGAGAKKGPINFTGLRIGSVIKVKVGGKTLTSTKVPPGCVKPPNPHTGFRVVAVTAWDTGVGVRWRNAVA